MPVRERDRYLLTIWHHVEFNVFIKPRGQLVVMHVCVHVSGKPAMHVMFVPGYLYSFIFKKSINLTVNRTPDRDPLTPILKSKLSPNVTSELGQQRQRALRFIASHTNQKMSFLYGTQKTNGFQRVRSTIKSTLKMCLRCANGLKSHWGKRYKNTHLVPDFTLYMMRILSIKIKWK